MATATALVKTDLSNCWPSKNEVLKEGVFICMSRSGDLYRVALTKSYLYLKQIHNPHSIQSLPLNCLNGVIVLVNIQSTEKEPSSDTEDQDKNAFLRLCFYVRKQNGQSSSSGNKKILRKRIIFAFQIKKFGKTFQQNFQLANEWKDAINGSKFNKQIPLQLKRKEIKTQIHQKQTKTVLVDLDTPSSSLPTEKHSKPVQVQLTTPIRIPSFRFGLFQLISKLLTSVGNKRVDAGDNIEASTSSSLGLSSKSTGLNLAIKSWTLFQKRLLIILNPKSGQGNALSIFERANGILKEAGIKATLLVTEYAGHAKSFLLTTQDLNEIQGIVSIGGDGLLHEIVNGLRLRPDAAEYFELGIGSIPGGSGNGLARSISHYAHEDDEYVNDPVLNSTLAIAHGHVTQVNVAEVDLDYTKLYSFLSVGWGFISDIDIESERLRRIGEFRFKLWTVVCLVKFRSYFASLTIKPNGSSSSISTGTDKLTTEGKFVSIYACLQPFIGTKLPLAPQAKANDGFIHLSVMRNDIGRYNLSKFAFAIEKGEHFDVPGVEYIKTKEFTLRRVNGFDGNLTIDGERVNGEYLRVKIANEPLRVFSH